MVALRRGGPRPPGSGHRTGHHRVQGRFALAVAYFAGFMKAYEAPANAATVIYRRGGSVPPSDHWRSNVHQRIVAWGNDDQASWLGRWNVDGIAVQVLHTRGVPNDPLANIDQEQISRARF